MAERLVVLTDEEIKAIGGMIRSDERACMAHGEKQPDYLKTICAKLRAALEQPNEIGEEIAVSEFYERAQWPLGTLVQDANDSSNLGTIVKRGGLTWVSRDKLPMVRWHGKIDAEAVPWTRLMRGGEDG